LRNYNAGAAELGAEPTMEAYLDNTMRWVKEVWCVLKPTGSFVLNIGDCWYGSWGGGYDRELKVKGNAENQPYGFLGKKNPERSSGFYKAKQLLSVSSFAYCRIVSETDFVCRGEHIWAKPNVPSPIRSRLKHSHEKLFWFVKDADEYYFDSKAWMKKVCEASNSRYNYSQHLSAGLKNIITSKTSGLEHEGGNTHLIDKDTIEHSWRIVPVGAKQSGFELEGKQASEHIAPYPENLIRPYIQSLCPHDGTTMDPFLGSGTTMRVAMEEGRNAIGCELNEKSIIYAKKRLNWGQGLGVEYGHA
jgi:DNA modification methylase